jgi:hypothetical protein
VALADRDQQPNRLRMQAACEEGQHVIGGPVQPLGILHNHQQRPSGGGVSEQLQRRQGDEEQVRWGRLHHAEGRQQRRPLPRGQPICAPEDRSQQLMQPGEGKARLRLHPGDGEHRHPPGPGKLLGLPQQRRLPDSGLAAHHQGRAAFTDPVDQAANYLQLTFTPNQRKHRHLAAMIDRPNPACPEPP